MIVVVLPVVWLVTRSATLPKLPEACRCYIAHGAGGRLDEALGDGWALARDAAASISKAADAAATLATKVIRAGMGLT